MTRGGWVPLTDPDQRSASSFGPRRLVWLLVLKLVLIAFAVWIALRVYGLA